MEENGLHKMFMAKLSDMYNAENQVVDALPKMIASAVDEDLADALIEHLEQTKEHVIRIINVAAGLGESLKDKKCVGIEGILKEGEEVLREDLPPEVKDAGIVAAAQMVEHYEIGAYGTLIEWARVMGHDEEIKLLKMTLTEEEKADKLLTKIAEDGINKTAFIATG